MTFGKDIANWTLKLTAAVALGAGIVTAAQAVTSNVFTYSPARTGYLTIHPMSMTPDDSTPATFFNSWSSGNLSVSAGSGCFNTGVNLPQNANITAIRMWYSSNASSVSVNLTQTPVATGAGSSIAFVTGPANAGAREPVQQDFDPPLPISNTANFYGLGVCLDANESFRGARITYTYTSAGD